MPLHVTNMIFAAGLLAVLQYDAMAATDPGAIETLLSDASTGGVYRTPDPKAVQQAERLFARLLQGEHSEELAQEWARIGFDMLQTTTASDDALIVVREQQDHKNGRGFYAIYASAHGSVVLQAPHSKSDLHTGNIALKMLTEPQVAAAAWNTVPRGKRSGGNADLAHLQDTFFIAFARAAARRFPTGIQLQLHGFDTGFRRSDSGHDADMIVSAGTRTPPAQLLNVGACLKHEIPGQIRIYPADVHELGGTTNSVGAAVRALGFVGFVHLEMSKSLRDDLNQDAALRRTLLRCATGDSQR